MISPPSTLPDDPVELKKIIAQISAQCDQYESRCKQYESENELLREQMRKLFDRLFPIGIRPARNPRPQSPKPLVRVLSLPVGFMLGVVLAGLDLDGTILGLLP